MGEVTLAARPGGLRWCRADGQHRLAEPGEDRAAGRGRRAQPEDPALGGVLDGLQGQRDQVGDVGQEVEEDHAAAAQQEGPGQGATPILRDIDPRKRAGGGPARAGRGQLEHRARDRFVHPGPPPSRSCRLSANMAAIIAVDASCM